MTIKSILNAEWLEWGRQRAKQFDHLTGFVAGEGGFTPKLLLLGEAPGAKEIESGHPFSGPAGKELDRWLAAINLTREDVYITSVVRARPYSIGKTGLKRDRKPTDQEVLAYAPMVDYELAHFANQLIVPMGNSALQRLLGKDAKIGAVHGQLLEQPILEFDSGTNRLIKTGPSKLIFPLYHPSYSKRFKKMQPVVDQDLAALSRLLSERSQETF